jgi:hypothetical protein
LDQRVDVSERRRIVVAAQGPAVRAREPHVTYEDHQSLLGKCDRETADGVAGARAPPSRPEQHDGRPIRFAVHAVDVNREFDSARRGEGDGADGADVLGDDDAGVE